MENHHFNKVNCKWPFFHSYVKFPQGSPFFEGAIHIHEETAPREGSKCSTEALNAPSGQLLREVLTCSSFSCVGVGPNLQGYPNNPLCTYVYIICMYILDIYIYTCLQHAYIEICV